jgi:predicted dehydrogenase
MNTLRIGLIGTGFAGRFHLECLRRVYGVYVQVAGVTSRQASSRETFGRQHDIPVYESAEAMLDHVDVLDVCSSPYAHAEAILAAASAGKGIICEKPLTGYFGPTGDDSFFGNRAPKEPMMEAVTTVLQDIARAVRKNKVFFGYAENFVYAPSIQKEREIVEKTKSQILRMMGEESHNGSASPVYGTWKFNGGGSLIGKGVHPLGAILYLKRMEGLACAGRAIRPASVSARTHEITRLPAYRDAGFIRADYRDIEDYGMIHLVFEDGTVADILTCELVLGGLYGYVEVFANNHRTRCAISPAELALTFNPQKDQYKDIYLIEKTSTKEGWSVASPDENFTLGYQAEIQDFMTCAATGAAPQSGLDLALDTTAVTYAAYVSAQRKGAEVEVPSL